MKLLELTHEFDGKALLYNSNDIGLSYFNMNGVNALFFISMKNKAFSRNLISWFLRYSHHMKMNPILCVVDGPYFEYEYWKAANLQKKDELSIKKLRKISEQVHRRVDKVIGSFKDMKIKKIDWDTLRKECPVWIKKELRKAFGQHGKVFEIVSEQSSKAIKSCSSSEMRGKNEFVLDELPVLLWTYYQVHTRRVDFYPGENAKIFTEIEIGNLSDELPRITRMVNSSSALVYANIKI